MIKEFRIGNLINNDNRICGISAMALGMYKVDCWGNSFSGLVSFSEHEIKPIALTEERLKKFGFETPQGEHENIFELKSEFKNKTYRSGLWRIDSISGKGRQVIRIVKNHEFIFMYEQDDSPTISVRLYYVHHLQNLFFTLTGEELKLK